VVSKNSGGSSSRPKLLAARKLSISVIMIDRPEKPDVSKTEKIEQVMEWLSN
jgi:precorrin-6A/cobalt-precorrin-6A reductase